MWPGRLTHCQARPKTSAARPLAPQQDDRRARVPSPDAPQPRRPRRRGAGRLPAARRARGHGTRAGHPGPLSLPTGSGCGPEIARTKAIVDSDVATGNLNKPVGDRFNADLAHAAAECSAGKSGEALHLLAAAKNRYGYR